MQAALGYQFGTKSRIIDSIKLCLLVPPLCSMTGVFLIQLLGPHRTFPSGFKISAKCPGRPWGLLLEDCPSFLCHWYLRTDRDENGDSVDVVCHGCSSTGSVVRPRNWEIHLVSVGESQKFWIGTMPEKASLPISWKTIPGICEYKQTEANQKIQSVSCHPCFLRIEMTPYADLLILPHHIPCNNSTCTYALCAGSNNLNKTKCFTGGEAVAWLCPHHVFKTPKFITVSAICNLLS